MELNFKIEKASPFPVYLQIKEQLKAHIVNNNLPPDTPLPAIKTIAKQARVCVRTAFLGVDELIKDGICFRRPKKGTFVGQAEKVGKRQRVIAVYYPCDLSSLEHDLIRGSLYHGIAGKASEADMDVFLTGSNAETKLESFKRSNEMSLAGMIIPHHEAVPGIVHIAEKFPDMRFIYLNYHVKDFDDTPDNVYGIFNDDFAGAYQMAEYLIRRGRRNISVFSIDPMPDDNYAKRVGGFLEAFRNNRIAFTPATVQTAARAEEQALQAVGRQLAERLFQKKAKPDAIACVNDLMAEGVVAYLRERKIDDVEVTGYDNIIPSASNDNNFSTLAIDFREMGLMAAAMLSEQNKHYPKIRRIVPQLIIRSGSYG